MKFIQKLLMWVVLYWTPNVSCRTRAILGLTEYTNSIEKWLRSNGPKTTIKRVKLIRLITTRYLSGQPLKVIPGSMIAVDKDGFPKCLKTLKVFAHSGNLDDLRFLLTLLCSTRALKYQGTPDYSSITDPFKGKSETLDSKILSKIIKDFDLRLEIENGRACRPERIFHVKDYTRLTTKAGPAGHALATSLWYMDKFSNRQLAAMGVLAGDELVEYFVRASAIIPKKLRENFGKIKYPVLRRLSIVNDPEMKCRVIAMADFWTQMVLRPLHKKIFKILRTKFSQDRTFTQNPFIEKEPGNKYHSLDLSNATDRIPVKLQTQILELMSDRNTAKAWQILMVDEPFLKPNSNEFIKYEVGQPMGALSSWGMMALTHHIIVQYSALQVGLYPFKGYILLGDDIVITNDKVAQAYKDTMDYLGVDISEQKTHVSENMYEFAKRWFYKGKEVTGLPLTGFIDNYNNPILMISQILDQIRKGNGPRKLGVNAVDILGDLYRNNFSPDLPIKKEKWIRSALHRAENFYTMQRLVKSFNYDEARSWLVKWLPDAVQVPAREEDLLKCLKEAPQASIGEISLDIMEELMLVEWKFRKKIEEIFPEIKGIPEDQHFLIYQDFPPFWAVVNAFEAQNRNDILLEGLHDTNKLLEKVVIPNMETAFTARKSVELAFSFDSMVKKTIKLLSEQFGDLSDLTRGKAKEIAAGWVGGLEDLLLLSYSPSKRESARINSMLYI